MGHSAGDHRAGLHHRVAEVELVALGYLDGVGSVGVGRSRIPGGGEARLHPTVVELDAHGLAGGHPSPVAALIIGVSEPHLVGSRFTVARAVVDAHVRGSLPLLVEHPPRHIDAGYHGHVDPLGESGGGHLDLIGSCRPRTGGRERGHVATPGAVLHNHCVATTGNRGQLVAAVGVGVHPGNVSVVPHAHASACNRVSGLVAHLSADHRGARIRRGGTRARAQGHERPRHDQPDRAQHRERTTTAAGRCHVEVIGCGLLDRSFRALTVFGRERTELHQGVAAVRWHLCEPGTRAVQTAVGLGGNVFQAGPGLQRRDRTIESRDVEAHHDRVAAGEPCPGGRTGDQ